MVQSAKGKTAYSSTLMGKRHFPGGKIAVDHRRWPRKVTEGAMRFVGRCYGLAACMVELVANTRKAKLGEAKAAFDECLVMAHAHALAHP